MTDQTVSLGLEGDASGLKAELRDTANVFESLAGTAGQAGQDIDGTLSGIGESAEGAGQTIGELDDQLAGLTDAERIVILTAETADAEARIEAIDEMLSDPSLTEAEVNILVDERNEASRKLQELQGEMVEFGSTAESVNTSAAGFWDDHSTAITGTGAAIAGAGVALEAFNQKQQDTRFVAARVANALDDQTTDSIIGLATEVHDATRDLDEMVGMMEIAAQQGLTSGKDLQDYAVFWDTVGDATGESAGRLAESSSALRAVGVAAGQEKGALSAFGFVAQETTGSIDEFLQFLSRTGPELRELGMDIDGTAALLGVLEHELGLSGRQARTEFREAINESDGSMQGLLETLGITEEQFATYTGKVAESSDVIQDNADAFKESRTQMQELQAWLDANLLGFSSITAELGSLTPLLVGGGGLIVGLNQLSQLSPRAAKGMSSLAGNMRRLAVQAGALAVIGISVERTINAWSNEMNEANEDASALARTLIGDFDPANSSMEGMHNKLIELNGQIAELDRHHDEAVNPFLRARYAETSEQLGAFRDELLTAEAAASRFQAELGISSDEALEMATNAEIMEAALDPATGAIDSAAGAAEKAAQKTQDYADSIRAVSDGLRAQMDPLFAAQDAMLGIGEATRETDEANLAVLGAQEDYTKAVKEFGDDSTEAIKAERDLADAHRRADQASRDAARSALDLDTAMLDLKAGVEDGSVSIENSIGTIDRWAREGKITEDQAKQMRDEFYFAALSADELNKRSIEVPMTLDARQFWDELARARFAVAMTQLEAQAGGARTAGLQLAAGGLVPQYLAGGGESAFTPRGTDTVPAMLTPGEFVVRAPAVDALGLDAMNRINQADRIGTGSVAVGGGGGSYTDARTTKVEVYYPTPEPVSNMIGRVLRKSELANA